MARVLVVGDANLDLVLRGDVRPRFGQAEQLLSAAELVLGGSAAIVASGLARLGVDVALAARTGTDAFGERTRELVAAAGVDVTALTSDPVVPSGLSVILSATDDGGGSDRAILTMPGTVPTLRADDVRAALTPDVRHVHVASYFLQPQLATELPALLADVRAHGASTSLDTNWDPAERWSGLDPVLGLVDVLLPNTTELAALASAVSGRPLEGRDAAAALHGRGPLVAVKDGEAGGWALGPDGYAAASGLAVDVVDTTGAGDSFDAGFLAGYVEGRPVAECLRWAAVAGSLSTLASGGTGAQPDRAELLAAGVSGEC